MPAELLVTMKVTPHVKTLTRQIAEVTGEKMYRVLLRVLTAEWQRMQQRRTAKEQA